MKYAVHIGSATMTHLTFVKFDSGIQRFDGGYAGTQTAWRSHKPTVTFPKHGKWAKNGLDATKAI
jgi:hypothetical protein